MGDTGQVDPAFMHSTKVFCTEAALKICLTAMEVFGGSGVMRELPAQKYVRDALVFQHMDGTQQVNRIKIGRILEHRSKEGRLSR